MDTTTETTQEIEALQKEMASELASAFKSVASAREQLGRQCEEPGFHDQIWQDAFMHAFDQFEHLKNATPYLAATLGLIHLKHLDKLGNQLFEEDENKVDVISLDHLGLDWAKRYFGYVLSDLETLSELTK